MRRDDDDVLSALGELARDDERDQVAAVGRTASAGTAAVEHEEAEQDAELVRTLLEPISDRRTDEIADAAVAAFGSARARPSHVDTRGLGFLRNRRAVGIVTALALAAGVAFLLLPREDDRRDTLARDAGPLPSYELTVSGGRAQLRSEPTDVPRLSSGAALVATLRPSTAVKGPVEARAFLVQDGRAQRLDLAVTIAQDGAVRLTGTIERLPFSAGAAEIVVTVTRQGVAHDPLLHTSTDVAQRLSSPVVLVEGP
jgi:hypothetical protein